MKKNIIAIVLIIMCPSMHNTHAMLSARNMKSAAAARAAVMPSIAPAGGSTQKLIPSIAAPLVQQRLLSTGFKFKPMVHYMMLHGKIVGLSAGVVVAGLGIGAPYIMDAYAMKKLSTIIYNEDFALLDDWLKNNGKTDGKKLIETLEKSDTGIILCTHLLTKGEGQYAMVDEAKKNKIITQGIGLILEKSTDGYRVDYTNNRTNKMRLTVIGNNLNFISNNFAMFFEKPNFFVMLKELLYHDDQKHTVVRLIEKNFMLLANHKAGQDFLIYFCTQYPDFALKSIAAKAWMENKQWRDNKIWWINGVLSVLNIKGFN